VKLIDEHHLCLLFNELLNASQRASIKEATSPIAFLRRLTDLLSHRVFMWRDYAGSVIWVSWVCR